MGFVFRVEFFRNLMLYDEDFVVELAVAAHIGSLDGKLLG
jgi:hypothetical protein